jgi:hypothetical protein
MTLLARKQAEAKAAAVTAEPETMLSRARATTPRGELTTMPLLGPVWIELAGEMVVDEIEGAVFAAMKALDLPPNGINALTYDNRRTALTLAWAVRDPNNHEVRAGTQEQWTSMDIDLLTACGFVYNDVRERLNPVGMPTLTRDLLDQIRYGIEKKNPMLLRSVGVVALSLYLLTGVDPPASLPTMPSSTGES